MNHERQPSPEFLVTKHAGERLVERLGCSERKHEKIARKAWRSRHPVPERVRNSKEYRGAIGPGQELRSLMGHTFIFAVEPMEVQGGSGEQKILITVIR